MNETPPPRRILRSVGAIFAGMLVVVLSSLSTDQALHTTGVFPPWGQAMSDALFGLATAYRTIYGIAGGYVTARLAPDRPLGHSLTGGLIGLAMSLAGAAATWNAGPEFGPKWYSLAVAATALPCAWVGGKLHTARSHESSNG